MLHKRISSADLEEEVQSSKHAKEASQKAKEEQEKNELIKKDLDILAHIKPQLTADWLKQTIIWAKTNDYTHVQLFKQRIHSRRRGSDLFDLQDENNESLKSHLESLIDTASIRITCVAESNRHLEVTARWGNALKWPDLYYIYPELRILYFFIFFVTIFACVVCYFNTFNLSTTIDIFILGLFIVHSVCYLLS